VPIDHVAIVNFESFKAMTDAIGGVDVNVAEASTGFPEGVMTMDGATGLEFVRERKELSQGDISRGERQQAVQGSVGARDAARSATAPAVSDATVRPTPATRILHSRVTSTRRWPALR
jgi:hypothetical protein